MWDVLADRPHLDLLRTFFDHLMLVNGEHVDFVVLYGSYARGDWCSASDYDVLIGLRHNEPGRQIDDREHAFDAFNEGGVKTLSFTPSDLEKMRAGLHTVLLAALRDGIVLYDRGTWTREVERYQSLVDEGLIQLVHGAWRLTADARGRAAAPL